MEGIGFLMLWGFSPAINCFEKCDNVNIVNDEDEINVLISQCGGDQRDLFKSLADSALLNGFRQRENQINFYIHEKEKENLARLILFLTLFCETGLSQRERMEIYLDLMGNCLLRDKSAEYLETTTKELIQLITEDEKCASVIKELVNFETLKFKERDDIEDIFSSYYKAHKFDIEALRDQRLRGHLKDRYDFRKNIVDWDYQMELKNYCPVLNQQEYRQWRLNGVAFETRLAIGSIPNRTLSSYTAAKSKVGRDSIEVRGFWGDIINSPYIGFGNEIWKEPEASIFKKQINHQAVYSNSDVSEFNVQRNIHALEDLEEYQFPFERLKAVLGKESFEKQFGNLLSQQPQSQKKKNKQSTVNKEEDKKEEEPMIEEITDEQAEQIEKEQEDKDANDNKNIGEQIDSSSKSELNIVEDKRNEEEKAVDAMRKLTGQIDLMQIDEGDREVDSKNEGTRRLLNGFKMLNVQIHLLSDDLDKTFTKQKYKELFDIGILSTHSANYIGKEGNGLNNIFKNNAKIHVETCDQLCILNKDQKSDYRTKLNDKIKAAGWEQSKNQPYSHHILYNLQK